MPQTDITITVDNEETTYPNAWYFIDSSAVNRAADNGLLDGRAVGVEVILPGVYVDTPVSSIEGQPNIRARISMINGEERNFDIVMSEPVEGYGQSVTTMLGRAAAQ